MGPLAGSASVLATIPEGTRFSEVKRQRLLERFELNGDIDMRDYARALTFVLPPRTGGVLALLAAAPEVDVVICSHTGFEVANSFARV